MKNVGIVGISGYGGCEAARLVLGHPELNLVYAGAGEKSAGKRLSNFLPHVTGDDDVLIQRWNPEQPPQVDLLIISLPTGESQKAVANISAGTKIIDLGGDHRFLNEEWVYGLPDIFPKEDIARSSRIANPGCYPTAVLTALAPLVDSCPTNLHEVIFVNALSGISGAGRGSEDASYGFCETNESARGYKVVGHVHIREMEHALARIGKYPTPRMQFTPHIVPMNRGILATCFIRMICSKEQCLADARKYYRNKPFVRVVSEPPQTKWATGSNLVFVSYDYDKRTETVVAIAAIDNLGKGAAGQAIQNANLMFGFPETAGLEGVPLVP